MSQVKHTHDQRVLLAWDGSATVGPAIDPWEGRSLVWHFVQRNLTGAANFMIECAPADPNDDTQPDNTAWQPAQFREDPCDKSSPLVDAAVTLDPANNGTVTSVEVPACRGCKFYRINLVLGPANTGDEVRVLAEICNLRNKG